MPKPVNDCCGLCKRHWKQCECFFAEMPEYFDGRRRLKWGEDLSDDVLFAMRYNAEVFLLCDKDGNPYAWIMKDLYGTLREQRYAVPDAFEPASTG